MQEAPVHSPSGAALLARMRARDPQLLLPALALIAIALGALWRFWDLPYPPSFTFDEHHFVENARNYLRGAADWNDHPPLGKLLMLPGLLLFGDNGLGWRFHEALMGVVHIALVGSVALGVFADRRAGWLAAAFVALDGLFVSYSRTALLDIPMNTFMMASLALMLHARNLRWFAAAAVMLGLGVAVKWIAVCIALVVPVCLWRRNRSVLHALWMGAVAVLTYGAVVAVALAVTGKPVSVGGMLSTSLELLKHHAGFTDWQNPADSRWYTWFVLWKPIVLFRADLPGHVVRIMSTVGNPVIWYATTAAFVSALVTVARASIGHAARTAHATGARSSAGTSLGPAVRAQGFLLFAAAALLVQWTITNRESYIWHYMGTYSLGLVLLAGLFAARTRAYPALAGAVLLVMMAVSVFYAPVWTSQPLSEAAMAARLFAPRWR